MSMELLLELANAVKGRPAEYVYAPAAWNPPTIFEPTPLEAHGLPLPKGSS
jgi:hypothetical protein